MDPLSNARLLLNDYRYLLEICHIRIAVATPSSNNSVRSNPSLQSYQM